MLRFDRISDITETGATCGNGRLRAPNSISDLGLFACHFKNEPVIPGCLGLEGLGQLIGVFLARSGGEGRHQALRPS